MTTVSDQRRAALRARRALSESLSARYGDLACRRLARLAVARRARAIGLYWPLASEIDPRPLIAMAPPGADILLPRVVGQKLAFVVYTPKARWRRSALGILELRGGQPHSLASLDLLVMPLAGFDRYGHRIGMGGGFYDRSLAGVRRRPYRSPTRIGLAFECQQLPAVESQPWDVELDAVVTERRIYRG